MEHLEISHGAGGAAAAAPLPPGAQPPPARGDHFENHSAAVGALMVGLPAAVVLGTVVATGGLAAVPAALYAVAAAVTGAFLPGQTRVKLEQLPAAAAPAAAVPMPNVPLPPAVVDGAPFPGQQHDSPQAHGGAAAAPPPIGPPPAIPPAVAKLTRAENFSEPGERYDFSAYETHFQRAHDAATKTLAEFIRARGGLTDADKKIAVLLGKKADDWAYDSLTTPDQIGKIVAERQSLKTKLPRDDARREQITALEQQSSNLSDLSARYTSYEKSRMALKAAAPYHKFVSVRVSPSQNRCWIRATMRPIIDEAMQNPTAYARVIDAIRSRPVQPENAPLLKLMERMHNTPSDQAKILNSTEFDNALAAYCRRVTFSIHNGSREPTDEEFNGMATAEKDARYNGYLLRHFNMSVNCLSASVDNQSPIGPLLPSSLVNDDTIFLTRHLLHGVPDHWNLLVAPAQASGGSGAAAAPPPANR